jgi:hypothetical protein
MKKVYHTIVLLLAMQFAQAQIHEIGVFAGGSNFIGDVGRTDYIHPNEPAIGILYKWNKSPRFAWRFSAMRSKISGNDLDSDVAGRRERGLQFENSITELSAGFEFNFFDFDQHQSGFFMSPYLSTGVNYFFHDNLYVVGNQYETDDNSGDFALPIIAGIKMKISRNLILGLESGAHYTFTDDIDGSFPKKSSLESYKFGNVNSKDWYVFTGLTLTYSFGEKPCYCRE